MEYIFELATNISTPLALGGLFATILFFILRQMLQMDVFRGITGRETARILKLVIDRLFILALIAMLLGFIGYLIPKIFVQEPLGNDEKIQNELKIADDKLENKGNHGLEPNDNKSFEGNSNKTEPSQTPSANLTPTQMPTRTKTPTPTPISSPPIKHKMVDVVVEVKIIRKDQFTNEKEDVTSFMGNALVVTLHIKDKKLTEHGANVRFKDVPCNRNYKMEYDLSGKAHSSAIGYISCNNKGFIVSYTLDFQ